MDREAFAAVLRRNEPDMTPGGKSGRNYGEGDFPASLAEQVAASGLMTLHAARRRIYSILSPTYMTHGRRVEQKVIDLRTADKILTALGLSYLLHTELADAIHDPKSAKSGPAVHGDVEAVPAASVARTGGNQGRGHTPSSTEREAA